MLESRLTAWELTDGRYLQAADVSAGESWTAAAPFRVVLAPARLVE